MEEKRSGEKISPSLAIVIIILVSVITTVLTALYVSLYNPPIYAILALAGILLGVGGVIFGFEIYRLNKKIEKIDKGAKILEIEQRSIETLPRSLRYVMIVSSCLLAVAIITNAVAGNEVFIALIPILIVNVLGLVAERKYEIYEKGIRHGVLFTRWNEIESIEWKDGILKIKAGKGLRKKMLRIRDDDGKIKSIIEKYVGSLKT